MIGAGKKLFLFSTVFMCVLMITVGMNGSLVCNAANQEDLSESTAPEKALTILNDVVGLDTATYRTNLDIHNQDLFFESLPQEHVKYTLESNESKLELHCNFVNEKLHSISVSVLNGSPHMTQPATNTLEMAKDFLSRYQTVSKASHCEALRSMLNTVTANENVTKTSGNTKLEVTINGNHSHFMWKYVVNGVEAAFKWVSLGFEDGFLSFFIDNWNLYKIGSYDINLSEEEAIETAMNAAKNYSWNVSMGGDNPSVEVTEFNIVGVSETTLTFCNDLWKNEARDGDPLTLYPRWRIRLYFDKLYPGNVYGLDVGIWADTGEVSDIHTMFLMGDYSSIGDLAMNEGSIGQESSNEQNNETGPNLTPIAWIALSISIAFALGATIVYSRRKKRIPYELHNMSKSNSLKLGGVLLCLLISLTIFSMTMPTVKADSRAIIFYGSTTGVAWEEQQAAKAVINDMGYYFHLRGYTTYNAYGSATKRENVLNWATWLEQNYDCVAMFHHGHGGMDMTYKQYRDYFDDDWKYPGPNPNEEIWDYDVWQRTVRAKHFFVFIWTCRQGDHEGGWGPKGAYGMPYAWHHHTPLSPTGPDCFIGFTYASVPLTQYSGDNPNVMYRDFVRYWAYFALDAGYSIIGALDMASRSLLGVYWYYDTELHIGYTAYWEFPGWPVPPKEGWGAMKIYGNPNIYLAIH